MLKIRLKRQGRKKRPCYRIIVINSKKRRDGRALAEVGFYNPLTKEIKLNIIEINKRVTNGAQFSNTVKNLFNKAITN